jgi:rSAM/selenodomain-associated transferase 1
MRTDDALVLMGKAPLPGTVKTRMCPPLSSRRAAELYACMLADVACETEALRGVRRYLFFAPAEGRKHFLAAPYSRFLLREQAGNDLGERMAWAMGAAFADGARRVAIVGGDCPALSAARIRAAFGELAAGADAVFGPARDGGFYLAGLAAAAPSLFRGIGWGGPEALSGVLSRCRRAGMTYALLPVERDVDTAADLAALRLWARSRPRPPCPRTRRWLHAVLPRLISPGELSSVRRGK